MIKQTPIPKEELELFKQLKDLKVIFDVGVRTDTDYLEIWPDSQHHLFEPNPEFFDELLKKIGAMGNKANIAISKYGLGEKNQVMSYVDGLQSFVDSKAINNPYAAGNQLLPMKTLDTYILENNIKSIDFLKMDTEGYELKILLGATNWFHIIKFIQYEHWGKHNDLMIRGLLSEHFDAFNVGYRNTFCMIKNLVSEEEKTELKKYIEDNKLSQLQ
mgnify:FL=1